jgi:hypothetical protein
MGFLSPNSPSDARKLRRLGALRPTVRLPLSPKPANIAELDQARVQSEMLMPPSGAT